MICDLCFGSLLKEFLGTTSGVFVKEGEICVCWCLIKSIDKRVSVNYFSSISLLYFKESIWMSFLHGRRHLVM